MRPVNLLPADLRPRRGSGGRQGSGYVALGVLGALFLLTLVYVVIGAQAGSREASAIRVAQQAQQAEARVAALGPYDSFARMQKTRSASVKALAGSRFDWERLMRELSLVLPDGTWLTEVDASVRPEASEAGAESAESAGPAAKIAGCAPRQSGVAKLMVRLRGMHGVTDVTLTESGRSDEGSTGGGGPVAGPGGGASQEGCGRLYSFDLVVAFEAVAAAPGASGAKPAPASLGGGS